MEVVPQRNEAFFGFSWPFRRSFGGRNRFCGSRSCPFMRMWPRIGVQHRQPKPTSTERKREIDDPDPAAAAAPGAAAAGPEHRRAGPAAPPALAETGGEALSAPPGSTERIVLDGAGMAGGPRYRRLPVRRRPENPGGNRKTVGGRSRRPPAPRGYVGQPERAFAALGGQQVAFRGRVVRVLRELTPGSWVVLLAWVFLWGFLVWFSLTQRVGYPELLFQDV